jgi:hypothetical protein
MVACEDVASSGIPGLDVTIIICITPPLDGRVTSSAGDAQPLGSKEGSQDSLECIAVVWARPGAILAESLDSLGNVWPGAIYQM